MRHHRYVSLCLIIIISLITSCRDENNSVIPTQDEITSYVPVNKYVTSPELHQLWQKGNSYTISWNPIDESTVKIELLKKEQVKIVISSNTPNDGKIDWKIPNNLENSNMYYIKITKLEDQNFSYTSGLFSIKDF